MDFNEVREISVHELQRLKNEGIDFQLIDVREADEREICHINGQHIPLGEIDVRKDELAEDKPVVVHCKSGRRSAMAILFLQQQYSLENLYNLKGGILEYAKEIDQSLTAY